jgi:hypothetical protein
MNTIRCGIYKHYTGKSYVVKITAIHPKTKEKLVICEGYKNIAVPFNKFISRVEHKGIIVDRFKFETDYPREIPQWEFPL